MDLVSILQKIDSFLTAGQCLETTGVASMLQRVETSFTLLVRINWCGVVRAVYQQPHGENSSCGRLPVQ